MFGASNSLSYTALLWIFQNQERQPTLLEYVLPRPVCKGVSDLIFLWTPQLPKPDSRKKPDFMVKSHEEGNEENSYPSQRYLGRLFRDIQLPRVIVCQDDLAKPLLLVWIWKGRLLIFHSSVDICWNTTTYVCKLQL